MPHNVTADRVVYSRTAHVGGMYKGNETFAEKLVRLQAEAAFRNRPRRVAVQKASVKRLAKQLENF